MSSSTTHPPPPASASSSSSNQHPNHHPSVGEFIKETGFYQSIRLTDDEDALLRQQSPYQLIEVYQTPYYGKVLVLDGVLQLTERDADAYNEMMTHVPMFQHHSTSSTAGPRNVLVIGGGDGCVVAEVLKHESIQHVDHVELDSEVIEVCKQHFSWGKVWNNERVTLHVADGAAFCAKAKDSFYDVIIQDSSDPWGEDDDGNRIELPSSVLFSKSHFAHIHRILKPHGIFNFQAETIQIPADIKGIQEWRNLVLSKEVGFASARYGSITISSYPTGQLGFLLCEKEYTVDDDEQRKATIQERYEKMCKAGNATSYYHPPLQTASFVLPLWAQKAIYGSDA